MIAAERRVFEGINEQKTSQFLCFINEIDARPGHLKRTHVGHERHRGRRVAVDLRGVDFYAAQCTTVLPCDWDRR